MRFDKFIKTVAPVVAMAVASGMARSGSGCDKPNFRFNGKEGVALDELDLSGDAPDAIDLVGPDIVRISQGTDFTIALEGDGEAKERMRFLFEDGALTIMRDRENWGDEDDLRATVSITMPPPEKLVVAGSGEIHSDTLARDANIAVAGSGRISATVVDADRLDVSLAGSGQFRADGRTERLELNIAGSGNAKMGKLKVDRAKIKIAGSGNATFASDGKVDARLMGSGNVTVRGNPRCTLKSFGSGTLNCEPDQEPAD